MAPKDNRVDHVPSRFRRWIGSTWALWTVIGILAFRATGFAVEYAQTGTFSDLDGPIIAVWLGWAVIFFVLRRLYA